MTIPYERTRAVIETYRFLRQLMHGEIRASGSVRRTAMWLERHYPTPSDIFMVAHGIGGVFADPSESTYPTEVPAAVAPDLRVELSTARYDELLSVLRVMPVPWEFDRRQWLNQWLDMPHPALQGATPRDVAERPGGFDTVWRILASLVDAAFQ